MPALTRRDFLLAAAAQVVRSSPQRVVILMCDGFGPEYLANSDMPTLARWRKAGVYKPVQGVMPSVTNANNASICCGAWPEVHGITGNSYWNARAGREECAGARTWSDADALPRAAPGTYPSAALEQEKRRRCAARHGRRDDARVAWRVVTAGSARNQLLVAASGDRSLEPAAISVASTSHDDFPIHT
jgi:hypothetical protein